MHKPFDLKVLQPIFCHFIVSIWYRLLLLTNQQQYFFRLRQTESMSHVCLDYRKVVIVFQKKIILFLKIDYGKFVFRILWFFLHISFIFWWHVSFASKVVHKLQCLCHLTLDLKWVSMDILSKDCSIWKIKFDVTEKVINMNEF